MSQSIVEMAKDLVVEQIQLRQVEAGGVLPLLQNTHMTLMSLGQMEGPTPAATSLQVQAAQVDWRPSITGIA